MYKEFIPYEQALELKELGFDEECLGYYYNKELSYGPRTSYGEVIEVPTFSKAFRFFREKYKLTGLIEIGTQEYSYNIFNEKGNTILGTDRFNYNGTYEEAELTCLKKLIEIVKNK